MKKEKKASVKLNVYPIIGGILIILSWLMVWYLAIATGFMDWSMNEYNKIVSTPPQVSDSKTK
jgi:NADH:ubiquinone oxidoreductase subunit 4 (subunit M)